MLSRTGAYHAQIEILLHLRSFIIVHVNKGPRCASSLSKYEPRKHVSISVDIIGIEIRGWLARLEASVDYKVAEIRT